MYEAFFALKEKPFSLTPNPRFLFLSKTHNEVYAHLIYGIENRTGFVEVTGEVGTGKTTILRTLLTHLDEDKYRVAFIFNPKLTAFELLRNINQEFGIPDDGSSSPDLINSLNAFLLSENQAGRTPILVIDEAQNLSGEVLEQIRLLSNLETEEDKLIQVVLVGQPELHHHLSDYSLRQLNQRIAVRYQLRPLNSDETSSYVLHRLKIAGRPDSNVFSPAAIKKIFKYSGGVPRRVNLICDRAMLTAFSEERSKVSVKDVNQAVAELDGLGEDLNKANHKPWNYIGIAAALAVLIMVGLFSFGFIEDTGIDDVVAKPAAPPVVESASVPIMTTIKNPSQRVVAEPDSIVASCNALFSLWEKSPLPETETAAGVDIDLVFAERGFDIVRLGGRFDELRKFNVPMLLPLTQEQGGGYLAVLGETSGGEWSVTPAYKSKTSLSSEELNSLGLQMAMVPWIDFASIGYVAVPGAKGENVRRLQFLLGLSACPEVPTDGRFNRRTMDCVKKFQREHGLVVDGLVGPRTLILLYQVAGAYNIPKLS